MDIVKRWQGREKAKNCPFWYDDFKRCSILISHVYQFPKVMIKQTKTLLPEVTFLSKSHRCFVRGRKKWHDVTLTRWWLVSIGALSRKSQFDNLALRENHSAFGRICILLQYDCNLLFHQYRRWFLDITTRVKCMATWKARIWVKNSTGQASRFLHQSHGTPQIHVLPFCLLLIHVFQNGKPWRASTVLPTQVGTRTCERGTTGRYCTLKRNFKRPIAARTIVFHEQRAYWMYSLDCFGNYCKLLGIFTTGCNPDSNQQRHW